MTHYDKDCRYMAARDLAELCATRTSLCQGRLQTDIVSAFLKQLEDPVIEVQGNAVSGLARVVGQMHEEALRMYRDYRS